MGDPSGIKRYINEYFARRLQPMEEKLNRTADQVTSLGRELDRTRAELSAALSALQDQIGRESRRSAAMLATVNMVARRHPSNRSDSLPLPHPLHGGLGRSG